MKTVSRDMPHFRLAAVLVGALAFATPAIAAEIVPVDEQDYEFVDFPDKPGLRVIVSRPMTVKLGGLYGVMGYRWVLEEGTYKDLRTTIIDEREIAFLPMKETGGGRGGSGTGSLGACYSPGGNFMLIDVNTGDILERAIWRFEVAESCGGGARLKWRYTFSKIEDPGDVRVVWGEEWDRMEQAAADHESRVRGLADIAEVYRDAGSREQKQQIGARICQLQGGIKYVGFTEGVSPDNGKIQIRVSEARYADHPRAGPRDFQPSILWDNPDAWELCE